MAWPIILLVYCHIWVAHKENTAKPKIVQHNVLRFLSQTQALLQKLWKCTKLLKNSKYLQLLHMKHDKWDITENRIWIFAVIAQQNVRVLIKGDERNSETGTRKKLEWLSFHFSFPALKTSRSMEPLWPTEVQWCISLSGIKRFF